MGRTVPIKCAAGSLQDSMMLWETGFRGRKGSTNEYGIWILNSLLFFLIKQEKSNVSWGIMILSCITYLLLQIKVMMLFSNLFWRSCIWKHRSLKAQKEIQQPRQVFWHTWDPWILLTLLVTYNFKTKLFLPLNFWWTNNGLAQQCWVNGWTRSS